MGHYRTRALASSSGMVDATDRNRASRSSLTKPDFSWREKAAALTTSTRVERRDCGTSGIPMTRDASHGAAPRVSVGLIINLQRATNAWHARSSSLRDHVGLGKTSAWSPLMPVGSEQRTNENPRATMSPIVNSTTPDPGNCSRRYARSDPAANQMENPFEPYRNRLLVGLRAPSSSTTVIGSATNRQTISSP